MEHMEHIKLDKEFVKTQINNTNNRNELAKACGCGVDKVTTFIRENGLYEYYCKARGKKYDPSKENWICSICGYNKDVKPFKGIYYCKRHYNQMYRYGEVIERTIYSPNDIIVEDETAKIIMRGKYQNVIAESVIDAEDVDKVKKYKWYLGTGGYCITKGIDPKSGIDIGNVIFDDYENRYDHISHDRLDNRKSNLRPVTQQQNAMNMGIKNTNTSGVTGVGKAKSGKIWKGRWSAVIVYNYKNKWLGSYATFDEAVHARLKGEIEYFGEYSPNYDPETQTIRLEYINPVDNIKHYVEYSLGGELLHDDQIVA